MKSGTGSRLGRGQGSIGKKQPVLPYVDKIGNTCYHRYNRKTEYGTYILRIGETDAAFYTCCIQTVT